MRAIVLFVTAFCLLAACSSPPATQQSSGNPSSSPSSNINSETNNNSNSSFDPNTVDASVIQQDSVAERRRRRIRPVHTPIPGVPAPPLQFREVGEDSTIAASMDSAGNIIEYRIFRSHPKLNRVEARWIGNGEIEFKIELRDGKIVTKKTSKIKNLHIATTKELVTLARN